MGCDIHVSCEVKENGIWKKNKEKVFYNSFSDFFDDKESYSENPERMRDYDWFAVLADVRNGIGFAGIKTGDGFDVISYPRGLPQDITKESFYEVNLVNFDDLEEEEKEEMNKDELGNYEKLELCVDNHSPSYIHLDEFENFDWENKQTFSRGCFNLEQYKKYLKENIFPQYFCADISGPNVYIIDEEKAIDVINNNKKEIEHNGEKISIDKNNIYVDLEWPVNYKERFSKNIDLWVKPMKKLRDEYGYEDVRIIFAFDN